jgi:hypothetical protein
MCKISTKHASITAACAYMSAQTTPIIQSKLVGAAVSPRYVATALYVPRTSRTEVLRILQAVIFTRGRRTTGAGGGAVFSASLKQGQVNQDPSTYLPGDIIPRELGFPSDVKKRNTPRVTTTRIDQGILRTTVAVTLTGSVSLFWNIPDRHFPQAPFMLWSVRRDGSLISSRDEISGGSATRREGRDIYPGELEASEYAAA